MATGKKFGRSQIDASDAIYDFLCNPCAKRGKNTEGLFKCIDCQAFYCQRCVTGHNEFTNNHNVVDNSSKLFGQGQSQSAGAMSSSELPVELCEEHHGEVIKMFCGQHDLVCCTVCIAVNHRSCEGVEYIPNIAKGFINTVDRSKTEESLERIRNSLKGIGLKFENELQTVNKKHADVLLEIQCFKKHIIKTVEDLEKKAIAELENKVSYAYDEICTSRKRVDDMLKDVEKQLEKLKKQKSNNEAQVFLDIKHCNKKMSDGDSLIREQSRRQPWTTLSFQKNENIEKCFQEVQTFGLVTVRQPSMFSNLFGKKSRITKAKHMI